MKKAILSAAGPTMQPLLEFAEPTFTKFAATHNYDLHVDRSIEDHPDYHHPSSKAARIGKIMLLQEALQTYDMALWIDTDAMFTKFDRDIADDMAADCFQGLVLEQAASPYRRGFNPNTGVWLMRQSDRSQDFLDLLIKKATNSGDRSDDQAFVCEALGWETKRVDDAVHAKPVNYSPYLRYTDWLPPEWNPLGATRDISARVVHFAGMQNEQRLMLMRNQYTELRDTGVL